MQGDNRTLGAPPAGIAVPPSAAFEVGSTLGTYRLLQLLGEGGMGRVFLAEHSKLGRRVAIKLLRPEYAYQPEAVARFFGEAKVVNQINHEHIVEIIDFVDGQGAEKYYVMEHLRGQSLRELLDTKGALPLERVLKIVDQICDALAATHSSSVVHRDLKPDNVFLIERAGQTDWVKLLDFGVAKLLDTKPESKKNQTAAGGLLGTPEYMAPEQLSGKPVDARSDIYALGVMMYELLAGKKPFIADSFGEIVVKHLTLPPPRVSQSVNVPKALDNLIFQCLEKLPQNRPPSMLEVRQRLFLTEDTEEELEFQPRAKWPWAVAVGVVVFGAAFWFVDPLKLHAPKPVEVPVDTAPAEVAPVAPAPVVAPAVPPPAEAPTIAADSAKQIDPKLDPKKKKRKSKYDRGGLVDPFGN